MKGQRSPTQKALDSLIFKVSHRKKRQPELTPSEIPTYDAVYPLLAKRWLRVRARTRA